MSDELEFAGRVALVTGASRGIGFGIAEDFARHGASVCITARKEPNLREAVDRLSEIAPAIGVQGKSDDPEHRHEAVQRAVGTFGGLDILVNNAATNPQFGPLINADLAAVAKVMAVNVEAVIGWIQQAWRGHWSQVQAGTVVNVASIGGLRPRVNVGAYNISKAALIHLTRQFALELAPHVRVNAVAPGVIKTAFSRPHYDGREQEVADGYPLKRIGEVDDVLGAARYLASEESSWVTGKTIEIDGGDRLG